MIHVLTFDATGTGRCLFTEQVDLTSIGSLEIQRATNIEFNNQTQQWEVKDTEGRVLYSHTSRAMCLNWEHQHFNR